MAVIVEAHYYAHLDGRDYLPCVLIHSINKSTLNVLGLRNILWLNDNLKKKKQYLSSKIPLLRKNYNKKGLKNKTKQT